MNIGIFLDKFLIHFVDFHCCCLYVRNKKGHSLKVFLSKNAQVIGFQKLLLNLTDFLHGADQHSLRIDAHHLSRRQVRDGDAGLAHQFFRLIILMNTA